MSVAQILQALAENAGRKQLMRGQVIGDTIAGASAVPAQIIEDRRKQALVDAEQRRRDEELSFRRNDDTRQRETYDQGKARDEVMRQAYRVGAVGSGGDPAKFNIKAALEFAGQSQYPEIGNAILEHFRASQKPVQPLQKLGENDVLVDPNVVDPATGKFPTVATGPTKAPPRGAAGSMAIGADGQPIAGSQIPFKPAEAPNVGTFEDYVIRMYGSQPTPQQLETARAHWAKLGTTTDDAAIALTPDALKLTAHQFAMTGTLPPMGMGRAAASVRTNIINEAAKEYAGLDLPSQVAAYNANKKSLNEITPKLDMLVAFEKAAGKNIDTFAGLVGKLPDTGVPWLNTPIRLIDEKAVGNEYLPAIRAAKSIATREVARVVNDPGLKGQLTDDARHGVEGLLNDDITIAQLKNVIPVLQNDMRNVHTSLAEQKAAIEGRIATPPVAPKPPAAPPPAAAAAAPREGDIVPITDPGYPPGAAKQFKGGQWIRIR